MYTLVICSYSDMQDVMEAFHVHTFFIILQKLQKTRRRMLLASIGGSLQGENEYGCCDVYSPDLLFDEQLDVPQLSTVGECKRRKNA